VVIAVLAQYGVRGIAIGLDASPVLGRRGCRLLVAGADFFWAWGAAAESNKADRQTTRNSFIKFTLSRLTSPDPKRRTCRTVW
jgi:hypothetical protein